MLKIFNDLKPFLEDTTIELSVRDFAKLTNTTPPTASKTLKQLEKESNLEKREFKKSHLYRINKDSDFFENLSIIFWKHLLRKIMTYSTT